MLQKKPITLEQSVAAEENADWNFARNRRITLRRPSCELVHSVFSARTGNHVAPNRDFSSEGFSAIIEGENWKIADAFPVASKAGEKFLELRPREVQLLPWKAAHYYDAFDCGKKIGELEAEYYLFGESHSPLLQISFATPGNSPITSVSITPLVDIRQIHGHSEPSEHNAVTGDANSMRVSKNGVELLLKSKEWKKSDANPPGKRAQKWFYKLGTGEREWREGKLFFKGEQRELFAPGTIELELQKGKASLFAYAGIAGKIRTANELRAYDEKKERILAYNLAKKHSAFIGAAGKKWGDAKAGALFCRTLCLLSKFELETGNDNEGLLDAGAMWFRKVWYRDFFETTNANFELFYAHNRKQLRRAITNALHLQKNGLVPNFATFSMNNHGSQNPQALNRATSEQTLIGATRGVSVMPVMKPRAEARGCSPATEPSQASAADYHCVDATLLGLICAFNYLEKEGEPYVELRFNDLWRKRHNCGSPLYTSPLLKQGSRSECNLPYNEKSGDKVLRFLALGAAHNAITSLMAGILAQDGSGAKLHENGLVFCSANYSWIDSRTETKIGNTAILVPTRIPKEWVQRCLQMPETDAKARITGPHYALVEINALWLEFLEKYSRHATGEDRKNTDALLARATRSFKETFFHEGKLCHVATVENNALLRSDEISSASLQALVIARELFSKPEFGLALEDLEKAFLYSNGKLFGMLCKIPRSGEQEAFLGDAQYHGAVAWPRDSPYLVRALLHSERENNQKRAEEVLLCALSHQQEEGAVFYNNELFAPAEPAWANPSPSQNAGESQKPIPLKNPAQLWSQWVAPYFEFLGMKIAEEKA